jgi:hypothetical protein
LTATAAAWVDSTARKFRFDKGRRDARARHVGDHKKMQFVVDVKSTKLSSDPVLQKQGRKTTYWDRHSTKRPPTVGALAGFPATSSSTRRSARL